MTWDLMQYLPPNITGRETNPQTFNYLLNKPHCCKLSPAEKNYSLKYLCCKRQPAITFRQHYHKPLNEQPIFQSHGGLCVLTYNQQILQQYCLSVVTNLSSHPPSLGGPSSIWNRKYKPYRYSLGEVRADKWISHFCC